MATAPKLTTALPPALVSIAEVCRILDCSDDTVRRLVKAGELACVRITNRMQFDARDVEKLIQKRKQ